MPPYFCHLLLHHQQQQQRMKSLINYVISRKGVKYVTQTLIPFVFYPRRLINYAFKIWFSEPVLGIFWLYTYVRYVISRVLMQFFPQQSEFRIQTAWRKK